jgi:hypothetical protein
VWKNEGPSAEVERRGETNALAHPARPGRRQSPLQERFD